MSYSLADCRVCLVNVGVWPIFGDAVKPDISMEIAEFGTIRLARDDDLPEHICDDCFRQLQGAVSFKKNAKRSDLLLKRRKKKILALKSIDVQNETLKTEQQRSNYSEYDGGKIGIDFVSVKESIGEGSSPVKDEQFIDENNDGPYFMSDNDNTDDRHNDLGDNQSETVMLDIPEDDEIKIKKETFHCKYCNLNYDNEAEHEEHRNTVEHKRNYVISFLPKKRKGTKCIVEKKVKAKDKKCEMCDKYFTKLQYQKHMESVHNMPSSSAQQECPVCKRMYNPISLGRHMRKVHGDSKGFIPVKMECPVCKKMISRHFFYLHMERHKQGDTRNYICDQCGKKFFFKSSFCTHRLIHTNELPHKCEYCPYRGRTKDLLKIHVRTHTGDYPYKCTQCDTRCLTKSNLNSHMRRHRGPVDFICDTCSRGFYSKIELERHITVTHYGVKNHVCSTCGAAFGYRHGLTSHERKVHKRPKGLGKPKALYLQLEEEGLLQPQQEV